MTAMHKCVTTFDKTVRICIRGALREIRIVLPIDPRDWGKRYIYWQQGNEYGADNRFWLGALVYRLRWVK